MKALFALLILASVACGGQQPKPFPLGTGLVYPARDAVEVQPMPKPLKCGKYEYIEDTCTAGGGFWLVDERLSRALEQKAK